MFIRNGSTQGTFICDSCKEEEVVNIPFRLPFNFPFPEGWEGAGRGFWAIHFCPKLGCQKDFGLFLSNSPYIGELRQKPIV
jgi:hypothetical protein